MNQKQHNKSLYNRQVDIKRATVRKCEDKKRIIIERKRNGTKTHCVPINAFSGSFVIYVYTLLVTANYKLNRTEKERETKMKRDENNVCNMEMAQALAVRL